MGHRMDRISRGGPTCWLQGGNRVVPVGTMQTHTRSAPMGLSLLALTVQGLWQVLSYQVGWLLLPPWCHCPDSWCLLSDSPESCECVSRTHWTNHVLCSERLCVPPGSGGSLKRWGRRTGSHPLSALLASSQACIPRAGPTDPRAGSTTCMSAVSSAEKPQLGGGRREGTWGSVPRMGHLGQVSHWALRGPLDAE